MTMDWIAGNCGDGERCYDLSCWLKSERDPSLRYEYETRHDVTKVRVFGIRLPSLGLARDSLKVHDLASVILSSPPFPLFSFSPPSFRAPKGIPTALEF